VTLVPTNSTESTAAVSTENAPVIDKPQIKPALGLGELLRKFGWQGGLIVAATVLLYAPVLWRLMQQWYSDPDYSHGFLVPFLSA
jgi:Transmembrane exosortase (Exosortase_EpsH)